MYITLELLTLCAVASAIRDGSPSFFKVAQLGFLRSEGIHRCGAFRLNETTAVTAEHCFAHMEDEESASLAFGSTTLAGAIRVPWYRIVARTRSKYTDSTPINDITFLTIVRDASHPVYSEEDEGPDPYPVRLFTSRDVLDTTTKCFILGWGNLRKRRRHGTKRPFDIAEVDYVGKQACRLFLDPYAKSQDSLAQALSNPCTLCAGGINNPDTCLGDSGGPLLCVNADTETHMVLGVTSYGMPCDRGLPSLYTDVRCFA